VYDVAVDVRRGSPTFGKWIGVYLSEENKRQLWVPVGFAHGICAMSDYAILNYKCTDYYNPYSAQSIRWNDPAIGIDWPLKDVLISKKDELAPFLENIPRSSLPPYEG